jgi:hypothetical protein
MDGEVRSVGDGQAVDVEDGLARAGRGLSARGNLHLGELDRHITIVAQVAGKMV